MRLGKTLVAGFLISLGSVLLVASLYAPLKNKLNSKIHQERAIVYLLFGLPIASAGTWLFWHAQKQSQKDTQARLNKTFYLLLQKNNGYITALQLAKEAGTSIKNAERYLEQKSKECNGIFELVTTGEAIYIFSNNSIDRE